MFTVLNVNSQAEIDTMSIEVIEVHRSLRC